VAGRRRLWTWEEELVAKCRILLSNVTLHSNVLDHWQWHPRHCGGLFSAFRLSDAHFS